MQSRLVVLSAFAAALIAAACGPATGSYGAASATTPSSTPSTAPVAVSPSATASPQATGAAIAVGSSRLGSILVDSSGRTLYLFVADSGTASTCNSASCVQNWPPFLTNGAPQAQSGVNASLLGTTKRGDGTEEVTYAGHPLYYFIADKKPGDITGQNIDAFGGPWYVVSPTGLQIR